MHEQCLVYVTFPQITNLIQKDNCNTIKTTVALLFINDYQRNQTYKSFVLLILPKNIYMTRF